jgi:hypothetical protein
MIIKNERKEEQKKGNKGIVKGVKGVKVLASDIRPRHPNGNHGQGLSSLFSQQLVMEFIWPLLAARNPA